MKYIVKNCGCNPSCDECYMNCANIDDCLIKQVVEKCRQQSYFVKRFPNNEYSDGVVNSKLAQDILQLFEIEECEE